MVIRAKEALVNARKALAEREEELKAYKVWRIEEEDRLIQTILLKKVKVGDIHDLRLEIIALKNREFEMIDIVKQAEAAVDQAIEKLDEARKDHIKAVQELEKLLEHRKTWQEEERLENEMREDLELEDFITRPLLAEIA